MTYGEARRVVTFNLDKDDERELFEFSKGLKFATVVKRYLRMEFDSQKDVPRESSFSEIQVQLGDDEGGVR